MIDSDLKQLLEMQQLFGEDEIIHLIEKIPISDFLDNWDLIPQELRIKIFTHPDIEKKIDILINLSPSDLGSMLMVLSETEIKKISQAFEPDDLVDILQTVDLETRQTIWNGLSKEAKEETLFLLKFDEDDAAGLMNPRFIAIRSSVTVKQALNFVRKSCVDVESIYYIYVIDYKKRLIGVVSIKDLLSNKDDALISNIMVTDVVSVKANTDQEEVAKTLETYDLVSLPVVDQDNKLLGIVTFDDIIDVIREEQTEDLYKLQGITGETQRYSDTSILKLFFKRIPWLIALLILGTATTWVMDFYTGSTNDTDITQILFPAIIGIYVPIILGTGGNTGGQSSTLIIRGLGMGDIHKRDVGNIFLKELIVGLLLAIVIGIVIFVRCRVFPPTATLLQAFAITSSLMLVVVVANIVGAMAPIFCSLFKLDPAVMSTPFMTTIIDVCGLIIYFEITKLILGIS